VLISRLGCGYISRQDENAQETALQRSEFGVERFFGILGYAVDPLRKSVLAINGR
jgi:hypothetical protein